MSVWYKQGTVSLTNGSKNVVGAGTNWVTVGIVSPGDVFIDAGLNLYEITTVTDDGNIVLATNYTGVTGAVLTYSVIRMQHVSFTTAGLASNLAALQVNWQTREDEIKAWLAGVAGGGASSDGKYPLTDATGVTYQIKCPAQIQAEADALIASINGVATTDVNNEVVERLSYEGVVNGVATTDVNNEVVERLSYEGVVNGVATTDVNNEVVQLPAGAAAEVVASRPTAVKKADGSWVDLGGCFLQYPSNRAVASLSVWVSYGAMNLVGTAPQGVTANLGAGNFTIDAAGTYLVYFYVRVFRNGVSASMHIAIDQSSVGNIAYCGATSLQSYTNISCQAVKTFAAGTVITPMLQVTSSAPYFGIAPTNAFGIVRIK